jgi:superfamily I DNA/RNA helicase
MRSELRVQPTKPSGSSAVQVFATSSDLLEASSVAEEIGRLLKGTAAPGVQPMRGGDIAVLYRAKSQSCLFEKELLKRDIKY